MMYTIVMANPRGGVGRTTITALLAWWLVEKEKARVAVLDLDGQRNLSHTLAQYRYELDAARLFSAGVTADHGSVGDLCLFAAGTELLDLERASPEVIPHFRRNVADLSPHFDYCLIDTPAGLGLGVTAALIAADSVLCPAELDPHCSDAVTATIKNFVGVRQRYNPRLKFLGVLASRVNPPSVCQREALFALFATHGQHVIPAGISTRSAIPEALSQRLPVWRLPQRSAREATAEVRRAFGLLLEIMRSQARPH